MHNLMPTSYALQQIRARVEFALLNLKLVQFSIVIFARNDLLFDIYFTFMMMLFCSLPNV